MIMANGIRFAVFSSPPVAGATPIIGINGGMLFGHDMLWPALAPLAGRRQIILYDQRGRGDTEPPASIADTSIEDDVADVAALRRALGVRRWDVVGHSWGGGIAALVAGTDPAGVRRLVTIDAVGPTSDWMPVLRQRALARLEGDARERLAAIDERTLTQPDPETHWRQASAIYPAWFADPALARRFTLPHAASPTGAAVLARLRREGYDWRTRLGAVRAPTLVMHGEVDALPSSVAAELVSAIPGARSVLLPDAGHMPFWEAPELLFAHIDAFL